jgi:hypothetical protein
LKVLLYAQYACSGKKKVFFIFFDLLFDWEPKRFM